MSVRTLLAQLAPESRNLTRNLDAVGAVLAEADAELVVFPELFLSGYQLRDLEELAVSAQDRHVAALSEMAHASGIALILGVVETGAGHPWNSALCFDRDGTLAAIHRKTHLFGEEKSAFEAADRLEPVTLAGRRVGVMICFELEFPEVARTLVSRGADLLVTISANMEPYAEYHDVFARARALENNVPHVYVNRVGSESGFRFTGGSCAIAPEGPVLAAAGQHEQLMTVDVPSAGCASPGTSYLPQLRPRVYAEASDQEQG